MSLSHSQQVTESNAVRVVDGNVPLASRTRHLGGSVLQRCWTLVEAPVQIARGARSLLVFPETQEVIGLSTRIAHCFHNEAAVCQDAVRDVLSEQTHEVVEQTITQIDALLRTRCVLESKECRVRNDSPPYDAVLNLSVTEFCNLRCRHCYSDSSPSRSGRIKNPEAVVRDFVSTFGDHERLDVALTGGEPTLWPGTVPLLKTVSFSSVPGRIPTLYVNTNGTVLTDEHARAFASLGVHVAVSLDGPDAYTHEQIRGPGTFFRTLKGMERLRFANAWFGVNVLIHPGNFDRLEELFDLAVGSGAKSINAFTLDRMGRASRAEEWPNIARDERFKNDGRQLECVPDYLAYRQQHRILTRRPDLAMYLRNGFCLGQLLRVRLRRRVRCGIGRHPTFYVSSDGSAYPDIALFHPEFKLGSVSMGFEQLRRHPFLEMMRNREPISARSQCASCPLRMFCGGGCPGDNFQRTGTLEPSEDICQELYQATEELLWILSERPAYFGA